ncbi:MAG: LPS-assembly protein LptD, partial [Candidatus Eremiobacteraeota bacterium]|nr:LPS-assembly protein LptD [Candidatus Eremiobacteraeota bacterium]
VRPSGTPSPIAPRGGPTPRSATPVPYASPVATLGPYQIVTIADHLEGSSDKSKPSDLSGNVHIFYTEGQIVGDRAHYDGDHTILVRGHTYLVNRNQDSILYADEISFDLTTRRAVLLNGSGESIEGVAQGKLHYNATQLSALSTGVTHGDRASFSTCENPHAGYHVEARTIDVIPGSKIIARKAVVFLGPTAILYLPLLVIPLIESATDSRRQASFIPVLGYDDLDGFYIKARIGFGTTDTYYGYYRVDYFTKRGLGLGYVAYIGAKDAHRYTTIDSYTISDRVENARETNVNIQDTENFSHNLRGQFGASYQGDFGPDLSLPASLSLTGSVIHQGGISTENLTFSRFLQGTL